MPSNDESGNRSIPSGFLSWVEKPLLDARAEVERVPLRLDEHRQWLAVLRAIVEAQTACRELHRLAGWFSAPGPKCQPSQRDTLPATTRQKMKSRTRQRAKWPRG